MNTELAIVGSHPDTRGFAPWGNPNMDIWVFNEAAGQEWVKGDVSAVFQLHEPAIYLNPQNRTDPRHWEWLQQPHPFPIYMQEADPGVPASVKFPLDGIKLLLRHFVWENGKQIVYLTNSIAIALAYAVYTGKYKTIHLWGCEMASNTEWACQRDCVTFWTGYALGRGIKIVQHCANDIYNGPVYGYEGEITYKPDYFHRRMELLESTAQEVAVKITAAKNILDTALAHVAENTNGTMAAWQKAMDTYVERGVVDGATSECQKYLSKTQAMMEVADTALLGRQEFEAAIATANIDGLELERQMQRKIGMANYVWYVWTQTQQTQALDQFRAFVWQAVEQAYDMGRQKGKNSENRLYAADIDRKIRAAGGEKAVEALSRA